MMGRSRLRVFLCAFALILVTTSGCLTIVTPQNATSAVSAAPIPISLPRAALSVYGQISFFENSGDQVASHASATSLYQPTGLACGGGYCYLSDAGNNRVLIFSGLPTAGSTPLGVLGQPDLSSHRANGGLASASASTLNYPGGVAIYGTQLLVADISNNRVLIWNSLPTGYGTAADVVVGQQDFASNKSNQGGSVASGTLSCPYSVAASVGGVYIADSCNNRVLYYSSVPNGNGLSAAAAIGQAGLALSSANQGGPVSASALSFPLSVTVTSSNQLLVSDLYNHRVLVFSSLPTTTGASANWAIGQADLTHGSANQGGAVAGNTLYYPTGASESGGKLYLSDYYNHRILYYSAVPGSSNASATAVLGQSNATSSAPCGSPLNASCLSYPWGSAISGGELFVLDGNNRVLVFGSLPTSNGAASAVYGQADATTGNPNGTHTPNAGGVNWSGYAIPLGTQWLVVTDRNNNRVMVFDRTKPGTSASYVIGQPDFLSKAANQGGSVSGTTLSMPYEVQTDGAYIYTADVSNNRVLVYSVALLSTGMAATYAIGQPDLSHNSANQGGGASATTLLSPESVKIYNNQLYVLDGGNCRIMVYNLPITSSNPAAARVLGQPDAATNTCPTDQQHYAGAQGLYVDGQMLIVAGGGRALFFQQPVVDGLSSAAGVFGQSDYVTLSPNRGGTSVAANNSMGGNESSIGYANGYLFISDKNNGRVLVFKGMPQPSTHMTADFVIGQRTFGLNEFAPISLPDGSGFGVLVGPVGISADSDSIYIGEAWGSRVIKIPFTRLSDFLNL